MVPLKSQTLCSFSNLNISFTPPLYHCHQFLVQEQQHYKYDNACHEAVQYTDIPTDLSSNTLRNLCIHELDLLLDLVESLLEFEELGVCSCRGSFSATACLFDFHNDRVASERTRVTALEFVHLGFDSAQVFAFHDVDYFNLFVEAFDVCVSEVFDEGDSAFCTDNSAFFDTVLVECTERLAGEVALDFSTAEQDEPDIGVGDDVGDDLFKTEVFGLTGTAHCGACVAEAFFVEV